MVLARLGARAPWFLALFLLLAACGGAGTEVRSCTVDADCGAGALCLRSACVTNRPPAVSLQLPPAPATHRVHLLGATASDPDPGDSITRYVWSVSAVSAACPAEPEPSSGAELELVFWCAGTYEVTVAAEDARGASTQARQTIEVAPASGAPLVTPAATSAVDHLCGGSPFACRPALAGGAVALPLSALVEDPAAGSLTYRWRVVPPAGVDPGSSVAWSLGPNSLATEAWLETPGGAIAGAWRFRLRVTTAAGLLGQAEQLVDVGNRPPELTASPLRLDHRHAAGLYLASGALPLPATDPDGDPVALSASLVESATAGCTTRLGAISDGAVPFEVSCNVPGLLLGSGSRTIRVVATDANGGSTEASFPVEIGNRPPVIWLAANPSGGGVAFDHSIGPCVGAAGSCYVVAGTTAFLATDPDGDPITGPVVAAGVDAALTSSAGQSTTAAGVATFRFTTALDMPWQFRKQDGSSGFSLVATAADPFGAFGRIEVPVIALNRAPVLKTPLHSVALRHQYDWANGRYLATTPLASFEDPDGDPLFATGGAADGDAECRSFTITGGAVSVTCARAYALASGLPPLAGFTGSHVLTARASDGWAEAISSTVVNILNAAPSVTAFSGTVESCFCNCPKWTADGSACAGQPRWVVDRALVPLPVLVSDADEDPVQVTYSGVTPIGGAQKTVFTGSCSAMLANPVLPLTVQVLIDDGVVQARTSSTVTGVTCSPAGLACTL